MDIQQTILEAADAYGLDPDLLLKQAHQESGLNQSSVSKAGARGVMQLMPETAKSLGVNANDATENIYGGAKYMRQMLDRYGGDYSLALAAYNAGPGRVDAYLKNGKALPSETQAYVPAIMGAKSAPQSAPQFAPTTTTGVAPQAAPALSSADDDNNALAMQAIRMAFGGMQPMNLAGTLAQNQMQASPVSALARALMTASQ